MTNPDAHFHDPNLETDFLAIVEPEDIDTRPWCCCACDTGVGMHADRRCGQRATTVVAMHQWGSCTDPTEAGDVDADGNVCSVMCKGCADHTMQVARAAVRIMLATMPAGITPRCPTCGRPTETAEDICETRPI